MITFVIRALTLSFRMLPNVILLYAVAAFLLYSVYLSSGAQFGSIIFLFALLGSFIILLMQIALIREGLRKLDFTEPPEIEHYIRAILNAWLLSLIQAILGYVMFQVYTGLLMQGAEISQSYIDSFGYEYLIEKVLEEGTLIRLSAILFLVTFAYLVIRSLIAAFLTVPLAAQAAHAGDGVNRGLLYGIAQKFYPIIMTWCVGNVLFFIALFALFIALNLSVLGDVQALVSATDATEFADIEALFAEAMANFGTSAMDRTERAILFAAFVILSIWWTSMWAASAAQAFVDYETETKSFSKGYIDALRQDGYGNVDANALRKSRE